MADKKFKRTTVTAALPYAMAVCISVTWQEFMYLQTSM